MLKSKIAGVQEGCAASTVRDEEVYCYGKRLTATLKRVSLERMEEESGGQ